ncbi:DUF6223 family protein [Nonomuraea sp. NPDC048826]|uniref:DUF6223 family protein n=1 Tax=Nonomuraea sp. NPDC048826 TaxID=3364347 RepID=UPI0037137971
MPARYVLVVAGAALIGVVGFAAPALAEVVVAPEQSGGYLTPGRLWSLVAGGVGLVGAVVGGLALRRPAAMRWGAVAALVAGLAGAVGGGLVVAAAEGGPGTGYGIVGGYVALAAGLVAMALGGLALARTRRTG